MKRTHPTRRRLTALAAGVAVTAAVAASAAGLGGLSADRIGAENTVVVAPFADGATVSWGDPTLVDGEYVIDEVTLSRNGLGNDDILGGPFTDLDASDVGRWWTSAQLNTNGASSTVDAAAGGLLLHEPVMTGGLRPKAGALYYTGLIPVSSVKDSISVSWKPLDAGTPLLDVLVQIPVYVGNDPVDVYQTVPVGSPIFGAYDNDPDGFFLNPVAGPTGATSTHVDPATTMFNLSPLQPYLLSTPMAPGADPTNPAYDPATYGSAPASGGQPAGTARTWTGTLNQFLANFPDAVTPGLFISLGSNGSTTQTKSVTITDVTFGDNWSFAPAPDLPAANVALSVIAADGTELASGTAVASGSTNSVTVSITPVRVADIAKVATVVWE